ncbi:MAG: zinc ribbon domain-containing protein [Sphaerochaeta sp.]|jgi:predicted  nucleic acid-binding Zn-ribbon protein
MQKEVFTKLTKLQDSLKAKFQVEDEIKTLPQELKQKQEKLELIKSEYNDLYVNVQTFDKDAKTLRFDYDNAVIAHEKLQQKMELISTQREFEALEKEISDSQIREQSLLKQLHAKEKMLVDLKAELEAKEVEMKSNEGEVSAEGSKIEEILAVKKAQLETLEHQCKLSISEDGISEELYKKFAIIVKNKIGTGIVPIHDNVCCGCHTLLPAQFVNDVRAENEIEFCPYCSRVLFYEDKALADTSSVTIEEGGLTSFTDDDEFDLDDI